MSDKDEMVKLADVERVLARLLEDERSGGDLEACWVLQEAQRKVASLPSQPDLREVKVYTRTEVQQWRDDAFEAAALICERYEPGGGNAALDIRFLKSAALPSTYSELREALDQIAIWSSPGNRTFDEMIEWMGMINDRARAALAESEK